MTKSAATFSALASGFLMATSLTVASQGHAADLATRSAPLPLPVLAAGPFFSAEIYGGYLTGQAREYVYNVPGNGSKLSQLNWQIDNAAILGARLAYRPLDWLSLRANGWTIVASDNAMDDFDWMAGYMGFDSWSEWSHSSDTTLAKGYQIDLGAAARFYQSGPFELSALAGYRFMTFKMNAYGGHYIYSSENGFRDLTGVFPDRLGIAYQQWWHTPYLGLGASYSAGPLKVNAEFIASPFVMSSDKDHHNLRNIVFEERFSPDWMVGVTLGAEYALTDTVSLTGQAEYQNFFEAKGGSLMFDGGQGRVEKTPKPAAGGDISTLMLSVGLKARL
ncbi:omptin family outer membrane protease [Microvirga lenta]|uniref:omptin family outer membrane protease n=1 Tax=Microvirga lenta TaxID=2881337 RepID=UPI001CFFD454|nr:omptin family outer membrane protease [Microvirga lenta]MCB5174886.1 omptin family outer membrane protease [Microvirga lenta]